MVDTIYDSYAVLHSTNWAIFNFASHYVIYGLIALKSVKIANSKYLWLCYSVALGYFIRATYEISKIGMNYDEYIISANNYIANLTFALVVASLITIGYGEIKRLDF